MDAVCASDRARLVEQDRKGIGVIFHELLSPKESFPLLRGNEDDFDSTAFELVER
jgi:hypothetical protein